MTYTVQGDTIRLNAAFTNFSGTGAATTSVTITIYDEQRNVLEYATTSSNAGKEINDGSTTGAHYYDYTTVNAGVHFFEYEGTLESKTITDKGTFYVTWA